MRRTIATGASALIAAGMLAPVAATAAPAPAGTVAPSAACAVPAGLKPSDITFTALRAKYKLNNNEAIPTLGQYLDVANQAKIGVLPEIKPFAQPFTTAQFNDYKKQVLARTNLSSVIIGNFFPAILDKFKADPQTAKWERMWFRSAGPVKDTPFVHPMAPPRAAEMASKSGTAYSSGIPQLKPLEKILYGGTTGGAPSATSIGLLNVGYWKGEFPFTGAGAFLKIPAQVVTFNVQQEFDKAQKPVYVWFNVATGGDQPKNGTPLEATVAGIKLSVTSPGWNEVIRRGGGTGPKWIATDNTAAYKEWAETVKDFQGVTAPLMVAHRGGGKPNISENSIGAFKQAVKDGAAVLETDVQWTKPTTAGGLGQAILMHDSTFNRTTKCRTKPGMPTIVSVVQPTKGVGAVSVSVAANMAMNNADYPTAIVVTERYTKKTCSIAVGKTACTISGLRVGDKFSFTAVSKNSIGSSTVSANVWKAVTK